MRRVSCVVGQSVTGALFFEDRMVCLLTRSFSRPLASLQLHFDFGNVACPLSEAVRVLTVPPFDCLLVAHHKKKEDGCGDDSKRLDV